MLPRSPSGSLLLCGLLVSITACATTSTVDDTTGTLRVHSLLGEEVLIDGGTITKTDLDEDVDVPTGTRAVQVRIDQTWSDPVDVEVTAGDTTTVDIPWEVLPVQRRQEVIIAVPDEHTRQKLEDDDYIEQREREVSEMLGEDVEMKRPDEPPVPLEDFKRFVETRQGEETPAGTPLVFETAAILAGPMGFKLQAGDRVFAADGEPIEELEDLVDVYNEVARGDAPRTVTLLRDGQKWSLDYEPTPVEELKQQRQQQRDDESESGDKPTSAPDETEQSDADDGNLTIYSRPRATIFVEGESTGEKTPATLDMEEGTYSVTVEFDDETMSEEKTVKVADDSQVKLLFRK